MEKKLTIYSSLWATVLMLAYFIFAGLLGSPNSSFGTADFSVNTGPGARSLQGRVIVLDPGHGGSDPGTIGVGPSTEAENVLAIAWELKGQLEKAGAKVIMTRRADQNPAQGTAFDGQENGQLAARVGAANRSEGQIFVSLHNNWNDNSALSGNSVYYYKAQDLALAESLQASLAGRLDSVDRGIENGNFYVLRNTRMPAALVEIGFLSNPQEAKRLSKPGYRLEVAQSLFHGIVDYFGNGP